MTPTPDVTDRAAVSAAAWDRSKDALRRYLRARLPSEADADDVLQDVFLCLHEGADRLAAAESAEAWAFAVARRAVADHYRRTGRSPILVEDTEAAGLADDGAAPPENIAPYAGDHGVHEEVLSWLRPMADELPETYRQALVMADFEGRPQQEVAEALGLSLSGAKSRVQRARLLLGDALAACCEVEFGESGEATAFRRRNGCESCEDDV